jgi:hypothetical protein
VDSLDQSEMIPDGFSGGTVVPFGYVLDNDWNLQQQKQRRGMVERFERLR